MRSDHPIAAFHIYESVLAEAAPHEISDPLLKELLAAAADARDLLKPIVEAAIAEQEQLRQRLAAEAQRENEERGRLAAEAEAARRAAENERRRKEQEVAEFAQKIRGRLSCYHAPAPAAREAVNALIKIEGRIEVGISYTEYVDIVGERWGEIKAFIESPDGEPMAELAAMLSQGIEHYKFAMKPWRRQTEMKDRPSKTEKDRMIEMEIGELLQLSWRNASESIKMANHLLDTTKCEDALRSYDRDNAALDELLPVMNEAFRAIYLASVVDSDTGDKALQTYFDEKEKLSDLLRALSRPGLARRHAASRSAARGVAPSTVAEPAPRLEDSTPPAISRDEVRPASVEPSARPTAPREETDSDDTRIFLATSFPLSSFAAKLEAGERVILRAWRDPPASIKFTLVGLEAVNEQLGGDDRLLATAADGELTVRFQRTGRNDLATFRPEEHGLSIQLSPGDRNGASTRLREWLFRCVLKTETTGLAADDDAADSTEVAFYAFTAPIKLIPLALLDGTGSFDPTALKPANLPLPPLPDDELVLGPGHVFVGDDTISFGHQPTDLADVAPYLTRELPGEFGLADVQVDWRRDDRDPNRWHVDLGLPDGDAAFEKKSSLAANQRLSSELEHLEKEHAAPLRHWISRKTVAVNEETSARINAHATALAAYLNLGDLPRCPDSTNDLNTLNEVRESLGRLAAEISACLVKLRNNRQTIVDELSALRAGQKRAMAPLWARASSLSATIYRRVGNNVLVPYAILGDPLRDAPVDGN